jgi:hypothetical protein
MYSDGCLSRPVVDNRISQSRDLITWGGLGECTNEPIVKISNIAIELMLAIVNQQCQRKYCPYIRRLSASGKTSSSKSWCRFVSITLSVKKSKRFDTYGLL